MTSQSVTLGVDLGTTNSAVAIVEAGQAEILENKEGDRTTPSVVRFSETGDREETTVVGTQAKNRAMEQPDRTVTSIKRHMGEEGYTVGIDGENYKPEEISAHILSKLRRDTANRLGLDESSLASIVVTVPAYFTEDSRQSTRDAAKIAGFENIEIINEPSASAMAYGYRETSDRETILVYDLGGGTFDVSVLTIGDGMFEVKATNGIRDLGGDDWDKRIVNWLREEFENEHGSDPLDGYESYEAIKESGDVEMLRRHQELYKEARARKKELSTQEGGRASIYLPFLAEAGEGRTGFKTELTHEKFKDITDDLIQQTVDPTLDTIDEAGYKASEIDEVLLVGGSTRMTQVEEVIKENLNQDPSRTVNPDEAVAQGAAIKGNRDDILLQEVTPLSLGVAITGGGFERLIPRNSTLPAEQEKMFTTAEDGRTSVRIDIYQGEREIADKNRHLKVFYLEGIPPQPRGMPSIRVTFRVSRTGLVTARAEDVKGGADERVEEVTIEGTNNLSDSEINDMIRKAEQKAEEDKRERQLREKREEAKQQVDRAETMLSSHGDLIGEEEKRKLDKQQKRVRNALEDQSTTVDKLDSRVEKLREIILEVGEQTQSGDQRMAGEQQAEASQPNTGQQPGTTDTNTDQGSSDTSTTSADSWNKTGTEPPSKTQSANDATGSSPSTTPKETADQQPDASPDESTSSTEKVTGQSEQNEESQADTGKASNNEDQDSATQKSPDGSSQKEPTSSTVSPEQPDSGNRKSDSTTEASSEPIEAENEQDDRTSQEPPIGKGSGSGKESATPNVDYKDLEGEYSTTENNGRASENSDSMTSSSTGENGLEEEDSDDRSNTDSHTTIDEQDMVDADVAQEDNVDETTSRDGDTNRDTSEESTGDGIDSDDEQSSKSDDRNDEEQQATLAESRAGSTDNKETTKEPVDKEIDEGVEDGEIKEGEEDKDEGDELSETVGF